MSRHVETKNDLDGKIHLGLIVCKFLLNSSVYTSACSSLITLVSICSYDSFFRVHLTIFNIVYL